MRLSNESAAKLNFRDIRDINIDRGKYFNAKIPFGYNYADENNVIMDENS